MSGDVFHPHDVYPQSVSAVVPLITEMLSPQSVIDFGCGVGSWLQEFRRLGVSEILGIEGSDMEEGELLIPGQNYLSFNLERLPELRINQHFDLALCLECAEHLSGSNAAVLVETLCNAATHVVFSAALPGQTGIGHINEQYPAYWRELFSKQGFQMFDFFRPLLWNDQRVEFWYRQNMYLFSKAPHLFKRPASIWDGSVYITRELFEHYVRHAGLLDTERVRLEKLVQSRESIVARLGRFAFRKLGLR